MPLPSPPLAREPISSTDLRQSNFHNYTLGKSFKDRACNRYMIDIDVAEPVEHNGMEWLSVKIHGQSFMLHQIVRCPFVVVFPADRADQASGGV